MAGARVAGGADSAEQLAGADALALADERLLREMHVDGVVKAPLALDHEVMAGSTRVVVDPADPSRQRGDHRLAAFRHQVDALMVATGAEAVAVGVAALHG